MASTSYKEDSDRPGIESQHHMEDSDVEELGQANEKVKHANKEKKAPVIGKYRCILFIQIKN